MSYIGTVFIYTAGNKQIIKMELIYSNEVRGQVVAYGLDNWDRVQIVRGLREVLRRNVEAVKRIENNVKNEGQATYSEKFARCATIIAKLKK